MMIDASYVRVMGQYNKWQNEELFAACDRLSDEERLSNRGAFFASIHLTLSHLLWADMLWMSRFADTPVPPVTSITESIHMVHDWSDLKAQRVAMDQTICNWSDAIKDLHLKGNLKYVKTTGEPVSKPVGFLISHFFNHQTHHRGQVHAMLTASGGIPYTTDLAYLPIDPAWI